MQTGVQPFFPETQPTQGFFCWHQILEGVLFLLCSILNCRICLAIDGRIPGGKTFSAQVRCLFVCMTLICCMMRLRMLRAVSHPDVPRWTVRLSVDVDLTVSVHVSAVSPRLLRKVARPRMRAAALSPLGGAVPEAQEAFPTLQTEVWSWGHGERGQLGHGDCVDR